MRVLQRLAKRLRALRHERGWTQTELAARAGVHRSFIAKLEAGQQDPALTTLEKLAKALRVKPTRLLG